MEPINGRLNLLFKKYYAKTATQQETDELYVLLHAIASDEQITGLLKNTWDQLNTEERIFNKLESEELLLRIMQDKMLHDNCVKPLNAPKRLPLWLKVAASVIIAAGASLLFYKNILTKKDSATVVVKAVKKAQDVIPGGNKAILSTSNGATIVLDNAQNGVLVNESNTLIKKLKDGQLQFINQNSAGSIAAPVFNTITTPKGGQYQAVLPDGTKVWLNSGSSITFPAVFTGKERRVELTGEAYFEVAKNAAMPYIVKTNKAEIRVLGTHFNIMDYDDERDLKTTLLEGSVQINNAHASKVIKPGEQALVTPGGGLQVTSAIDVNEETAWKNGMFQFNDNSIEEVMRQIARWYDVKITYEGKISTRQINGAISRNVNLSELVKMLRFAGVDVKIEDKTLIVSNTKG